MNNTHTYVTLTGMPLSIELRWPFHKSTSGGDFHVLHGVVTLADGSGLHANVALHLSAAIEELLPSLEPKDTTALVINAVRKWTDKKEFEFIKSTKLQPLPLSSRFLFFKSKQWHFEDATDDQIAQLMKDQLYWNAHRQGTRAIPIADPIDLVYTGATGDRFRAVAQKLVAEGWATFSADKVSPTTKLVDDAPHFENRAASAHDAIKQKHAFEASKSTL